MAAWERDPTENIINDGYFRVVDPGPLHTPVEAFSIHRDDKLDYVLKTSAPSDAKSNRAQFPSGTVRISAERVELEAIGGAKVSLIGVITHQVIAGADERGNGILREKAKVHRIEGSFPENDEAAYAIDWLGNVAGHSFIWPDIMHTETETKKSRALGRDKTTVLTHENKSISSGSSAVKLTVAGVSFYLCASSDKSDEDPLRSGCIIYLGTPDDSFRRKIRDCLSFSLGIYLVHLGTTTFNKDWHIFTFESLSAYSMGGKAFSIVNLPPAPLHLQWQFGIDENMLSRSVNAIYAHYDELKFGTLSWAYWHAQCATPHIAGVHFGAAIEALLRCYIEARPNLLSNKVVSDRSAWKEFAGALNEQIGALPISNEDKTLLTSNIGLLNRAPLKALLAKALLHLGITLGEVEWNAWKRRNDAAHGNDMEPGGELSLIRDNKLLSIIFHRLLLRMTNASDLYQDCFVYGYAIRRLEEPVPENSQ